MVELKPCPFCGGDRIKIMVRIPMHGELISYYVICAGCGARSAAHIEEQYAIEAWNKRVETDPFKLIEIDHVRRAEHEKPL